MPLGIFVPLSNLQMLNISGTHLNNETLQILNPLAKLKVSCDSFQSKYHIRTSYIMQKYIHVYFSIPAPSWYEPYFYVCDTVAKSFQKACE